MVPKEDKGRSGEAMPFCFSLIFSLLHFSPFFCFFRLMMESRGGVRMVESLFNVLLTSHLFCSC